MNFVAEWIWKGHVSIVVGRNLTAKYHAAVECHIADHGFGYGPTDIVKIAIYTVTAVLR